MLMKFPKSLAMPLLHLLVVTLLLVGECCMSTVHLLWTLAIYFSSLWTFLYCYVGANFCLSYIVIYFKRGNLIAILVLHFNQYNLSCPDANRIFCNYLALFLYVIYTYLFAFPSDIHMLYQKHSHRGQNVLKLFPFGKQRKRLSWQKFLIPSPVFFIPSPIFVSHDDAEERREEALKIITPESWREKNCSKRRRLGAKKRTYAIGGGEAR